MPDEQVTRLLGELDRGDRRAADRLMPIVYDHLRAVAGGLLGAGAGQTIQPTALVNEAYLKLVQANDPNWAGKTHFFAVAATAMRQILIDNARRRGAAKRGGGRDRVTLDAAPGEEPPQDVDTGQLGEALEALLQHDPRAAQIVELRFFAGMTNQQIASHLGISERTVRYDWRHARAWLAERLGAPPPSDDDDAPRTR